MYLICKASERGLPVLDQLGYLDTSKLHHGTKKLFESKAQETAMIAGTLLGKCVRLSQNSCRLVGWEHYSYVDIAVSK